MAFFTTIVTATLPYITGGIVIGVLLVVIYDFLGKIFNSSQVLMKAKDARDALLYTIGLLGGLYAANYALNLVISSLVGMSFTEDIHLTLASFSLDTFYETVKHAYFSAFLVDGFMATLFTLNIPLPIKGNLVHSRITLMPLAGIEMLMRYESTITNIILMLMSAVLMRIYLLKMIPPLTALLLPFAVLFRVFPFSRSMGSAIFALIFTIYFAYPLSILYSDYLLHDLVMTVGSLPMTELTIPTLGSSQTGPNSYKDISQLYSNIALNETYRKALIKNGEGVSFAQYAKTSSMLDMTFKKMKTYLSTGYLVILSLNTIAHAGTYILDLPVGTGKAVRWGTSIKMMVLYLALSAIRIASGIYLFLRTPVSKVILAFFDIVVLQFMYIGSVTTALFITLVLEITITVETYKVLSEVFGGEALLFGLHKVI